MKAYSSDLREKILAQVDAGMSKARTARTFGVGRTTVNRYLRRRRETGSLDRSPVPGRTPTIRPDQREALRAQVAAHPTAILVEQCDLWEASHQVRVSISTMSREIRRLGFTRKKGRWVPPNAMKHGEVSGTA